MQHFFFFKWLGRGYCFENWGNKPLFCSWDASLQHGQQQIRDPSRNTNALAATLNTQVVMLRLSTATIPLLYSFPSVTPSGHPADGGLTFFSPPFPQTFAPSSSVFVCELWTIIAPWIICLIDGSNLTAFTAGVVPVGWQLSVSLCPPNPHLSLSSSSTRWLQLLCRWSPKGLPWIRSVIARLRFFVVMKLGVGGQRVSITQHHAHTR